MNFKLGDYTNCYYEIAEIVDEFDDVVCTVSQEDVDEIISIMNENEKMKFGKLASKFEMGDYTVCRYDIAEIVDEDNEVVCTVATDDVDVVIEILTENLKLKSEL